MLRLMIIYLSLTAALFATGVFAPAEAVTLSSDRVFAYAEANYPTLFPGPAADQQFQQYTYRYYPATANYLAVDTANVIFMLGPETGNVITNVGTVASFADAIIAWEALLTTKKLYSYWYSDVEPADTNKYWMSNLPDDRPFSALSLPGTHGSIAREGPAIVRHWVLNQLLSLEGQMNSGIRAFDIRLRCTGDGNFLVGYHSDYYQYITFDDILNQMASWLQLTHHEREALFVRIKNEGDTDNCAGGKTFSQVFKTYYDKRPTLFWSRPKGEPSPPAADFDPKLGDVRGKIVVLQDFGDRENPVFGLNYERMNRLDDWNQDTIFSIYDKKWLPIKERLVFMRALGRSSSRVHVTFLSASGTTQPWQWASGKATKGTDANQLWYGWGPRTEVEDFPHENCSSRKAKLCKIWYFGTNELTFQWLRNAKPESTYTGIVYADFPGPDLITVIIQANFWHQ